MRKIFLVAVGFLVLAWTPVTTSSVGSTWTTLCQESVATNPNVAFKVRNNGSTNPFTACRVQSWIGPNADDSTASGLLTISSGNAGDGETVTIDGKVYTFEDTLTNVDGHVHVGTDAADSLGNLVAAINKAAGGGSKYAALTSIHPTVSAVMGTGNTMAANAKDKGAGGNAITTVDAMATGSWGSGTLLGGLDSWTTISSSWTDCASLAPKASTSWAISGNSHERIRVQAKAALGTSAYCKPSGN